MGDLGFAEALGTVGILYRDTEYTQCATGTARRRAYDALENFRSTSSAQSVDVLGGTPPAITVAATGTLPSCCSSVAPARIAPLQTAA